MQWQDGCLNTGTGRTCNLELHGKLKSAAQVLRTYWLEYS